MSSLPLRSGPELRASGGGLPRIELTFLQKVRTYYLANPTEAATLESLLALDKAQHPKQKDRVATDALMWLLRGLKFTSMGLRNNLSAPTEELSASFTKAYEGSLRKFHGMMVRPIFAVS